MSNIRPGAPAVGYRKVLVATSAGTLIEVYDILIYGYFAAILSRQFFPPGDPTAALLATFAIFAVGFLLRPLGGVIFGHVGDRFGRRNALASSLLLMTLATMAFGLVPTHAAVGLLAPVLLLLCRVLQGLSVAAELPGASLLLLEHAPINRRGLAVSINTMGAGLATVAAATVSLVLARLLSPDQLANWGWRVAFLIAAPIGIVGIFVRTRLLDSPPFLALGETARRGPAPLARAVGTAKRGMLVLAVWFGAQSIAGYTLTVLMPTYLILNAGLPPAAAYATNLIAVLISVAFTPLGGFLVDRFPLRPMAITVMAGTAVTAIPGFLVITAHDTAVAAVIGQVLYAIFLGPLYIVGAVLALTLFPTGIRFTALAVPLNLGIALFGGTAPYVSTWLTATTHSPLAPAFYVSAAAAAGTLGAIFGLRHRDVLMYDSSR